MEQFAFDYIVGKTPIMLEIFEKIQKIAQFDVSVLVEGESGTGKELVARAIHYNSPRRNNEFVVINCSAFSDSLLESELFGHMKGSFTGAIQEKKGLFEVANNGTFFLDEIADMSPALQVKLLRVVQEGTFLKIGGIQPVKVNVRIIAASNKNLKKMIEQNSFREDLYYRINVTSIFLPPLRSRKDDIPLLVDYFLKELPHSNTAGTLRVSKEALQALLHYQWPGNIRQLENEIERAAIFARNNCIDLDVLSSEIVQSVALNPGGSIESGMGLNEIKKMMIEKIEREIIVEWLEKVQGNKSECARILKVSRGDLMRKISKYKIGKPEDVSLA